jgi:23S rRNA (guanine745-N1)-methyltransferase
VTPPLACTVRDCGLLLERRGTTFVCARRHSYDVARSGYLNLLQPQDRRSPQPGDSVEAIGARARLIAAGVGARLIDTLAARVIRQLAPGGVVVDLGSGSGELLGAIRHASIAAAIGIDLSTAAAGHAARHFPDVTWVVANADRRLPLLDGCVDVMLSVHGRRNPAECARVLARGGALVAAMPAPDDLTELRARVQGHAVQRERGATLVDEHDAWFTLEDQFDVREQRELDRDALRDLLRGTYRGERRSAREQIESLDRLSVTLASTVYVMKRRRD